MGCRPTKVQSVDDTKTNNINSSNISFVNEDENVELSWEAETKTQLYHWWPMLETFSDEDDPINNLYAKGGGLYKYDKIFGTKGVSYQKKHYYIDFNSKREDKKWAGFCDRAAMLSCLYEYPKRAVKVRVGNDEIIFKTRDIEALMIIAADNSTRDGLSVFYGSRNNHKNKSLTGEISEFYKSKKSEPLPLELLEVMKRFSKEKEPFVMDVDNGHAVWNYPFDSFKVTREPIELGKYNLYSEGRNVLYRFEMKTKAYPDKNMNILGCVNYHNNFIRQKWLSKKNPDFLWKEYARLDCWRGKCRMNPHYNAYYIYQIYKQSLCDEDKTLSFNA